MKRTSIFLVFILFGISFAYQEYNCKREIIGINQTWHKIEIPNEMLHKLRPDIADIRIIGINAENDTIEAPYLLTISSGKKQSESIPFKLINQAGTSQGFYFTFKNPGKKKINKIKLSLKNDNFDWLIQLQGSHDQKKWYTLLEKYRILALKNEHTDYRFTELNFLSMNYTYIRLFIPGKIKPELISANLEQEVSTGGRYQNITVISKKIKNNSKSRETEILLKLAEPTPVSWLKVDVVEQLDYLRFVNIQYLADSTITQRGIRYHYQAIKSGYLSSLEQNIFRFKNTIMQQLRIIIKNHDNQPLNIKSLSLKGNLYELTARFSQPAKYNLYYFNPDARSPRYDISHFEDKIPEMAAYLSLGPEIIIPGEQEELISPILENQVWLWLVMIGLVLFLGWYTLKMIRHRLSQE